MAEGYVKSRIENRIAFLDFYHPSSNALPSRLLEQLAQSIQLLGTSPEVSVIVLQSGGERAFCAGASLDELASLTTEAQGKAFFSGFAHVINAMRQCPRFILGRVQGKAVGGGVGLIASTDYCLATQNAGVRLSELTVGIGPFVIEPAVKRKIGLAATSHLTINATEFESAIWAWQKGLYDDVFDSLPELDIQVRQMAERLATYDLQAMSQMKQVLWEGTSHWGELLSQRAALSGSLVLSDFARKKLAALKPR
jgi:methylglutaconyl-CoA hydratase